MREHRLCRLTAPRQPEAPLPTTMLVRRGRAARARPGSRQPCPLPLRSRPLGHAFLAEWTTVPEELRWEAGPGRPRRDGTVPLRDPSMGSLVFPRLAVATHARCNVQAAWVFGELAQLDCFNDVPRHLRVRAVQSAFFMLGHDLTPSSAAATTYRRTVSARENGTVTNSSRSRARRVRVMRVLSPLLPLRSSQQSARARSPAASDAASDTGPAEGAG